MYTNEELNLITLCSFEELSYKQAYTLLSDLNSAEADFDKYGQFLIKSLSDGVYNKVKAKYFNSAYREKLISRLDGRGIKCVTYFSKEYPDSLKFSACPPIVLFCKGNISLLKTRCIAVVGSRRTLPNMLSECKTLSGELSKAFTVVSGLADGADAAALEGALPSGKVISVLAYGLDHVYPSVNAGLLKKIEKSGLIITEYTPQIKPKPYNFPVRNRIIAGLSEGSVIVSAGKESGALITARYANELSRLVFAFPYTKGVSSGEGCNALIKEGAAKLIESAGDIFTDFNLDITPTENKAKLSPEEEKLFNLIREAGEAFVNDIADKMDKLPFQLLPLLTKLEMKGLVVRLGGNRYSAT